MNVEKYEWLIKHHLYAVQQLYGINLISKWIALFRIAQSDFKMNSISHFYWNLCNSSVLARIINAEAERDVKLFQSL